MPRFSERDLTTASRRKFANSRASSCESGVPSSLTKAISYVAATFSTSSRIVPCAPRMSSPDVTRNRYRCWRRKHALTQKPFTFRRRVAGMLTWHSAAEDSRAHPGDTGFTIAYVYLTK